jgi:hypothetical protein
VLRRTAPATPPRPATGKSSRHQQCKLFVFVVVLVVFVVAFVVVVIIFVATAAAAAAAGVVIVIVADVVGGGGRCNRSRSCYMLSASYYCGSRLTSTTSTTSPGLLASL